MEQAVEPRAIRLHHLGIVLRQAIEQKKSEHAALAVAAKPDAGGVGCGLQAVDQRAGPGRQCIEKSRFGNLGQGGNTAGGGDRVARQRTGLVDRAQRRELLHHRALGAEGRQRHSAADHLAHDRHVGLEARQCFGIDALGASQRDPAAGHDFVKYQQRAVLGAQLAAALHEGNRSPNQIHVAGNGLDHQARQLGPMYRKSLLQLLDVVVLEDDGVANNFGRNARTGGVAEGRQSRTGLDQQRVGVAVVATFELDQLVAPGGAARKSYGAHRGLGSRTHQAHHVH